MNGIYDFEGYNTPYLDMEMLMERKEMKRKRRLLILSGIATFIMTVVAMMMIYLVSTESKTFAVLLFMIFGIYIVGYALIIGKVVKKGEYLWQL